MYLALKFILSAGLIVLISTVGKRLPTMGALIASLPLLSILAMLWMYQEKVSTDIIAAQSEATFWYVLPSLPLFLIFSYALRHGIGFFVALGIACSITIALYAATVFVARRFGVSL